MRRTLALLAAVVVTAVTAGCTGTETPGDPGPARTSAASGSQATPAPQRPGEIDLAGVDPCGTVTERQRAKWSVDRPPRARTLGGGSLLAGSPSCAFGSTAEQTGFVVTVSTKLGLDEFLASAEPSPSRRDTTVGGFRAVREEGPSSAPDRGSGECYVDVDVADGQLLEVQYSQISASQDKRLPIETLCAEAGEVAEAALTTLQGG